MYVQANKISAWVVSEDDARAQSSRGLQRSRTLRGSEEPLSRVIEAKRPTQGKVGRCLALRKRGERLEVLVAANATYATTRWMSAENALTEQQAQAWARTGF